MVRLVVVHVSLLARRLGGDGCRACLVFLEALFMDWRYERLTCLLLTVVHF